MVGLAVEDVVLSVEFDDAVDVVDVGGEECAVPGQEFGLDALSGAEFVEGVLPAEGVEFVVEELVDGVPAGGVDVGECFGDGGVFGVGVF